MPIGVKEVRMMCRICPEVTEKLNNVECTEGCATERRVGENLCASISIYLFPSKFVKKNVLAVV